MNAWGFLFYILIFHSSPQFRGEMDPVDFKKENKRKKSISPPTFIAPNPTQLIIPTVSPSKCRRHCAYAHAKSKSRPLGQSREHWGLCGHKSTPPAFHTDLGGVVHRKDKPSRFWMSQDLELSISYCSASKSKSTDRFNSQQDTLCCGVYVWEIKDKLNR